MKISKSFLVSTLLFTGAFFNINAQSIILYDDATGSAEIYEIADDGDLGTPVKKINSGWRKTWTDIEYYRADGKDMMLFYEGSTGSAEMYQMANDGDLGPLVKKIDSGWRKTWTEFSFNPTNLTTTKSNRSFFCTAYGEHRIDKVNVKNYKKVDGDNIKVDGNISTQAYALVASSNNLWPVGSIITVSIDDTVPLSFKQNIINIANEWSLYANISFQLVSSNGDIHLKFNDNKYSSLVGTQSKEWFRRTGYDIISKGTMTLDVDTNTPQTVLEDNVLHEFGHALGFNHEHKNPSVDIPWDKEKVYESYRISDGWDRARVDQNIFNVLDKGQTQYSSFDPNSIMIYPIPNELTIGNFSIANTTQLSNMDKIFAGVLYPFPNSSVNRIKATITTGDDDLREKSNANLIITYGSSTPPQKFQISLNRAGKWDNHSTHSNEIPLPNGIGLNDILSITLFFGSGKRDFPHIDEDDSWKVNNLIFEFMDNNGNTFPIMEELRGNPFIYFVGKDNPYLEIEFN